METGMTRVPAIVSVLAMLAASLAASPSANAVVIPGTLVPRATFTSTATPLPTQTVTSTATASPTVTATATGTRTSTPLPTGTATSSATATPTRTTTITRSPTPTSTPIAGFHIDDVQILEGHAGTSTAVFTVRLEGLVARSARVTAMTTDATAVAGSDYVATSATLVFSALQRERTFAVQVIGDRAAEADEAFLVRLVDPDGAAIVDGEGIGTIIDDDTRVGSPQLLPPDQAIAVGEIGQLTLRWAHPERWRDLATVDLRLADELGVLLWTRFDETANTLALCQDEDVCDSGNVPGADAIADAGDAAVHLAESAVVGSGPTGPSVDLVVAVSFAAAAAGRRLRVEAAATDDDGTAQDFEPVGQVAVADPGDADDDGCRIAAARSPSAGVWLVLATLLVGRFALLRGMP